MTVPPRVGPSSNMALASPGDPCETARSMAPAAKRTRKGKPPVPVASTVEPPEPSEALSKPFLKWAGGKWSLAEEIGKRLPRDMATRTYREPFLGGGALFFWLRNQDKAARFVLSDQLTDLIATYETVRDETEALVRLLRKLKLTHSKEHFYAVRDEFNSARGSRLQRAAWLIYLNKTCFNGLFRTNRAGEFNVPMGRFQNPAIADEARLRAAARALAGVSVENRSFEHLLRVAEPGDVIYLDPPYVPISPTSNFAAYSNGHFGSDEQIRLAEVFRELDRRGCLLALSNSNAEAVHQLYRGFDITTLSASRAISSKTATRGPTSEVLVRNTARYPKSRR